MDRFDTWFSRFMWGTDIVFLAASTPHIAAWYAHFDGNPGDWLSSLYAWSVGFGLAIAIDGVSLMLLFALTRMIKSGKRSRGTMVGILLFMAFIASLSWLINWQYDKQFASNAFAQADGVTWQVFASSVTVGNLNPVIGGAFNVLILAYALIARVVKSEVKPALTNEEYAQEKLRIEREQELKRLRKGDNQGLLARGKEAMLGQDQGVDEVLHKVLMYLRDARELLPVDQEERAVQALSAYLNIRAKTVLPLLIQARNIIAREDQDRLLNHDGIEQEDDQEQEMNDSSSGSFGDVEGDQDDILLRLQGRDTVPLDVAASVLNCQMKTVIRLRNQGRLKHASRRDDLITVASLRAYLAARGRRGGAGGTDIHTEKLRIVSSSEDQQEDKLSMTLAAMRGNAAITDEELAVLLGLSRPASARFWRLKAVEMLRETVNV